MAEVDSRSHLSYSRFCDDYPVIQSREKNFTGRLKKAGL